MLKYLLLFYSLSIIAMEPPEKEEKKLIELAEFFESKGFPREIYTEIEKFRFPNYDLLADFLARTQLANENYKDSTPSVLDDFFLFPPF